MYDDAECICGTEPEIEDAQGRNPNCTAGGLTPVGVELPVKLVIGDGAIVGDLGTVTLDLGDTPDKVIAEFLFEVAKAVAEQSTAAQALIDAGVGVRVEVPQGEDPARYMPGTTVVRGTPEALALLLGNAEDVNRGGDCGGRCDDSCLCGQPEPLASTDATAP